jgi:hypothetical protein
VTVGVLASSPNAGVGAGLVALLLVATAWRVAIAGTARG